MDRGKDINLTSAISKDTITKGLKYSLATGNWGVRDSNQEARPGVSQVRRHELLVSCATLSPLFGPRSKLLSLAVVSTD